MITVVDGRSEAAKSNCVPATFLLGAIHRELGLDYDDNGIRKGEEFALSAKDRRFVFTKPEALSNVRFAKLDGDEQSREACKIIRNGEPAFLADRSGRVVAGRHE
ncbi:MAG TPA: hypothetical protein VNI79_02410 [Sphingomicrobium sp.]|nr:hypothetical protein [Sphingomicrobium sp.]